MERSGVLPTNQFAPQTLQNVLGSGQETRIVSMDFSAAFDSVAHNLIFYKFCSVGIGGAVLFIRHSFYQIGHITLCWTDFGVI